MADEPIPETPVADPYLDHVKMTEYRRVIDQINAMGSVFLSKYPDIEAKTWPIQSPEAAAVVAAGEGATLAMAPFLAQVCAAQFGPADDATRLMQVKEKAALVHANAAAWSGMAAFANGLRARADTVINGAADITSAYEAVYAIISELEAFRATNGI